MKFKFIDLFAGIGGFHLAMHRLGGECVFASEIDEYARLTYQENYQKTSPKLFENNLFNKDIRTVSPKDLPDFDVLCAGFPCQPFSQAGYKRGFADNHSSERGNLFFNIAEILEAKKPKAFFLENVRGLVTHDKGKTFKIIRNILENELGYSFYYKVVHASDYGLPQLRPRVFIVGFRDEGFMNSFNFPAPIPLKFTMSDVWQGECSREIGFTIRVGGRGSDITDRRNWDNYLVDGELRRLSYIEAKKMQGFPNDFEFPVSKTQAIKQLGNSVAVDAVEAVAKNLLHHLETLENNQILGNCKNIKGGNSNQKADILLDIENEIIQKENEGFGIKSYLGSKPTLLNASGNTNFIFKINGIEEGNKTIIDEVNKINTRTKLKDRINKIEELGGFFEYVGAEKETMDFNLKMIDSQMPQLIGKILLCFYKERVSSMEKITKKITAKSQDRENTKDEEILLKNKIKNLLVSILLGFFAGTKWNGSYESNGTIVMKNDGNCVGFHVVEMGNLKNYLFENIKLDTPSTTRHRFGQLYSEKNGELFFKLNLQLRFS
ncbi:HpaII family restriction endonuclease [Bernardetia sp. MNP-M8]|uniref:HpaII family restriction endonuclease n=1 Tax=Bernardetia sp. MNP-M8 TaxID=3127470 RepID=UPI0030D16A95